jgi:hypothetical protein
MLQFLFVALTSVFFLVDVSAAVPTFPIITANTEQNTDNAWRKECARPIISIERILI